MFGRSNGGNGAGRAINDVASRAVHAQQLVAAGLLETLTASMRAFGHEMSGEQYRGTSRTQGEYIAVRCKACGAVCAVAFEGFVRSYAVGKGYDRTISRVSPPACEFREKHASEFQQKQTGGCQ